MLILWSVTNDMLLYAQIWRRSYDVPPPALTPDDEEWSGNDPKYAVSKPGFASLLSWDCTVSCFSCNDDVRMVLKGTILYQLFLL